MTPADLDARVFRRLATWLGHAVDEQVPDTASEVLRAIEEGRLSMRVDYDPDDELCWLALDALDPRFGPDTFLLHIDARNVGLLACEGRLYYRPDPLLDDDLPGELIPL